MHSLQNSIVQLPTVVIPRTLLRYLDHPGVVNHTCAKWRFEISIGAGAADAPSIFKVTVEFESVSLMYTHSASMMNLFSLSFLFACTMVLPDPGY